VEYLRGRLNGGHHDTQRNDTQPKDNHNYK